MTSSLLMARRVTSMWHMTTDKALQLTCDLHTHTHTHTHRLSATAPVRVLSLVRYPSQTLLIREVVPAHPQPNSFLYMKSGVLQLGMHIFD